MTTPSCRRRVMPALAVALAGALASCSGPPGGLDTSSATPTPAPGPVAGPAPGPVASPGASLAPGSAHEAGPTGAAIPDGWVGNEYALVRVDGRGKDPAVRAVVAFALAKSEIVMRDSTDLSALERVTTGFYRTYQIDAVTRRRGTVDWFRPSRYAVVGVAHRGPSATVRACDLDDGYGTFRDSGTLVGENTGWKPIQFELRREDGRWVIYTALRGTFSCAEVRS